MFDMRMHIGNIYAPKHKAINIKYVSRSIAKKLFWWRKNNKKFFLHIFQVSLLLERYTTHCTAFRKLRRWTWLFGYFTFLYTFNNALYGIGTHSILIQFGFDTFFLTRFLSFGTDYEYAVLITWENILIISCIEYCMHIPWHHHHHHNCNVNNHRASTLCQYFSFTEC